MAEVMLNHLGQGRFKAYSAGSHPKGTVDLNSLICKTWDACELPSALA
jgi:arsenate reductase (thioredoxin)